MGSDPLSPYVFARSVATKQSVGRVPSGWRAATPLAMTGKMCDPGQEVRIGYSLLLLLQASSAPPVAYDTRAVTQACASGASSGDIIVCGRRDQDRYRIPKLPPDARSFGTAETNIRGVTAGVGTELGNVGGIPTNRVMMKLKIPL